MAGSVIDIHTHMLGKEWLRLIGKYGPPDYGLQDGPEGQPWIYERGFEDLRTNQRMFDYESRIQAMNTAGIDVSIVSLTSPNVYWGGAEGSAAAARAINDDMAEAQKRHPDRIRFLASLPWQYPALAVTELDRAVGLGAVGVMVLANIRGAELVDPLFAPVWKRIDEHKLPVLVHPANPPGFEHLNLDVLRGSVGFTFDTTLALGKIAFDGFLDRYPGLTLIGCHAGGTIPYQADRIDMFAANVPPEERKFKKLPSCYFERMYFDCITYGKGPLQLLIEFAGHDHVMFGTDYPHRTDIPGLMNRVREFETRQQRAIFGGNAERLFRF